MKTQIELSNSINLNLIRLLWPCFSTSQFPHIIGTEQKANRINNQAANIEFRLCNTSLYFLKNCEF